MSVPFSSTIFQKSLLICYNIPSFILIPSYSAASEEQCKTKGACLHFTLYDHDKFTSNDIGGEAFILLQDITGVEMYFDKGVSSIEPMPLCLRLPEKEGMPMW